eukprot:54476_1
MMESNANVDVSLSEFEHQLDKFEELNLSLEQLRDHIIHDAESTDKYTASKENVNVAQLAKASSKLLQDFVTRGSSKSGKLRQFQSRDARARSATVKGSKAAKSEECQRNRQKRAVSMRISGETQNHSNRGAATQFEFASTPRKVKKAKDSGPNTEYVLAVHKGQIQRCLEKLKDDDEIMQLTGASILADLDPSVLALFPEVISA